jgi:hypothetical protein
LRATATSPDLEIDVETLAAYVDACRDTRPRDTSIHEMLLTKPNNLTARLKATDCRWRALMKKEIALVLATGLLMGGPLVASATTVSQSTKALGPEPVQNISGEKIPGARNGMLAEMLESHLLSGKYVRARLTKHS